MHVGAPRACVCVAIAAVLGLAGCSSVDEPPPSSAAPPLAPVSTPPPGPAPELVAWIDRMCSATRLMDKRLQPPAQSNGDVGSVPPMGGAWESMERLEQAAYVNDVVRFASASIELLEGAGPAPVPGGAEMAAGYVSAMQRLLRGVEKYNTRTMDENTAANAKKVGELVSAVRPDGPDLASLLSDRHALREAHGKAPNCGPDGMYPQPGEGVPTPTTSPAPALTPSEPTLPPAADAGNVDSSTAPSTSG
jgi:hypothetical protein